MYQNNLQKKQELLQKKADAGLVSERFPQVLEIVIEMTYYQRTMYSDIDTVLMIRTVNVSPDSHAYFHMPCMIKECTGEFDLTPVIKSLTKGRKKKGSGKLACPGKGPNLPDNHASINYDISIKYSRKRK